MAKQHGSAGRRRYASAGSGTATFVEWLRRCCREQGELGQPIENARPLRTSSGSVTLWEASATTSFAAADRTDPDVAQALALGFDVVRRDAIGETMRLGLGDQVFVLQMRHAPGGRGKKQLGVVLHVGRTFFVYLLSSARASNLDADTDDRRGNAATELIATVVREMTSVGRGFDSGYRPKVFAREHARIVRDEQHGADLKATFMHCRVIAYTPQRHDLTKPADAQTFSFGSMLSAASADANILGMNRAEIVIQANGGFNEDIRRVPFTHGPLVSREVDHRTGIAVVSTDKHRIALTQDVQTARTQLRRLVDKVLEDRYDGNHLEPATDWRAVGDLMAEFDLPSRKPEHLKKGFRLKELPAATRERAARSLFSQRWIAGWRDGEFEQMVPVKIAMELDLSDSGVVEELMPDGRLAYRCRIRMPLPEDGWGISDEEWDQVLHRRYPLQDKPRVYTGTVLPLAGIAEWDDGTGDRSATTQFDVCTSTRRYVLRSRPIEEARNADGSKRGWDDSTVTRCGGSRAKEWHRDVARAMREALLGLDRLPEPVVLSSVRERVLASATTGVRGASVVSRKAELEDLLENARLQREGAADARNIAWGRHRVEDSADSAKRLKRAEADLDRATSRLEQLETELEVLGDAPSKVARDESLAEVGVETATAEFVAAALEKCDGGAPGWLQEACQVLLTDVRLVPHHVPGERPKLRWTSTLRLTTVDETGNREVVGLPLAGEVFNRTNAANGGAVLHGPEAWAWAFFYEGRDWSAVGKDAGVDGSGKKNSYLYKGLNEWLCSASPAVVPDTQLRTAALDCPIPATRRVLWSAVTGDVSALAGLDQGFVQHILQTYGGSSSGLRWGWCKDTHQLSRRAADVLLANGGSATVLELAEQLNVSPDRVKKLARENRPPTKGGAATYPARLAVPPFTKNWTRGRQWLDADERRLSLRPCPHKDCPERLRGGVPYASHVLHVPETEVGFGVLCPHCWRLPIGSLADVRFPADYRRPWSGRFGHGSHAGARAYAGSHIDPNRPDPGPATPLPNTGSQPRPETVINRDGNYLPKRLQARPLGGRRILPLGLTQGEHDQLAADVERLGGRLASKVTKSLSYLVVRDSGAAKDTRAKRAAALGAELMTFAEFRRRACADWPDSEAPDPS